MPAESDSVDVPRRRPWLLGVVAVLGLLVAFALDVPAYRHVARSLHAHDAQDFMSMLRTFGYLPTWLIAVAALLLADVATAGRWSWSGVRRAAQLLATIVTSGIVTELLKLSFRRHRPGGSFAWFDVRPFWDRPFSSGGLSMPSSHASIAFGAAFALCRLFPAARPVWIAIGVGTAASRVLVGAHYVSDVYVAAFVAAGSAAAVDAVMQSMTRRQSRTHVAVPSHAMEGVTP